MGFIRVRNHVFNTNFIMGAEAHNANPPIFAVAIYISTSTGLTHQLLPCRDEIEMTLLLNEIYTKLKNSDLLTAKTRK